MKRILCLTIILLLVVFTFFACLPSNQNNDSSSETDSSVGTDSNIADSESKDSSISTDTDIIDTDTDIIDTDTDTDTDTDNDVSTDTDAGDDNEGTEPIELSAYKTATELASSIGKYNNGDSVSGKEIALDSNISVIFDKGTSTAEPALYNDAIRLYQKGGTLTVNAKNGYYIQSIKITVTGEKDGNGMLTVSGGSAPGVSGDIITITSSGASAVTITTGGSSKEDRLYISDIEVVYLAQGGTTIPDEPQDTDTDDSDSSDDSGEHLFYDFTSDEKISYLNTIGFVIPFLPNDDYYIESYNEDGYTGIYYSALCNSEVAFTWYLAMFSSYESDGEGVDDFGDTWYYFYKDNIYIDVCYYEFYGAYYVDVDAYFESTDDGEGDDGGDTDNESIITNEGAGLPSDDGDGIFDVDFTDADKVKDVTDQLTYLDGCPTVGSPGVLVIPVEFSDRLASNLGYSIDNIKSVFEKDGKNEYYSVYDYYYISSIGQLSLDITVVDNWFKPSKPSTYYRDYTMNIDGEDVFMGDQLVMDEALAFLDKTMDLSKYDSDNNGTIDAVVLVTTLKNDGEADFYWAYRYWNYYTDNEDYYYEYDGVSANDYLWASYEFIYEDTSITGDYSDTSIVNPYTFIHEFGHILGAEDYYDTTYYGSPLGGYDIMDSEVGDHNPYTKFNLGWITSSRLIVTDTSVTLTLEDFSKNGDTIILANNFDPALGAYQEYYILMYYTDSELNSGMGGYFDKSGIVVYHIDASLFCVEYAGEIYYDVYNTNTEAQNEGGTLNNLVELMPHGSEYVYIEGEAMKEATDNTGTVLGYTFTVVELGENEATITVSAK